MNKVEIDKVINCLEKDEGQLFTRLGYEIFELRKYALPKNPTEAEYEGKRWFRAKLLIQIYF